MRRRRQVLVFLAGAAAVWGAGPLAVPAAATARAVAAARGAVPAGAVQAAGSWGRAIDVPGLRALNKGGNAQVSSVSCASRGNCAAGGYYRIIRGSGGLYPDKADRGFVASERKGRWGRAIRVPGLATLSAGQQSSVDAVSCSSAGNCVAGGDYWNHGHQGFVEVEKNGRWGRAIKVAGPVHSVSCAPAGNCAAGGAYTDGGGHQQGFVAAGKNGRWGQAIEVPGLAALNTGGNAEVSSVSCAPAGNCAAGGTYRDGGGFQQAFVASEKNGRWGPAIDVPGLKALDAEPDQFPADYVGSVSCASAGNCAAGGTFGYPYPAGFVASEKNGVWGQVIVMPGWGAARTSGVSSVSCASAGNCAAGGGTKGDNGSLGFVAAERIGRWGLAIVVPGLAALNKGYAAPGVVSVSCASAGNCTAGGGYTDGHGGQQGFVTQDSTRTRPARPAGPSPGTLDKRT